MRFAKLVAPGGSVLDVACGSGRHARWLETSGYRVTGIDRDATALSTCGASETLVCDLETEPVRWPLPDRTFDAVIVTNYLHRPLFPLLVGALASGGVLLYETFACGNGRFGKPSNPAFLLDAGELLGICRDLRIVAFEDGLVASPRPASIQRICAVRDSDRGPDARRHPL